jgi:flagellar biogenesis protein FliO
MLNYLLDFIYLCSNKFLVSGVVDSTTTLEMPSFGTMIFKLIFSLFVIVVILYFSIKLFKKYSSQGKFLSNKNSNIIDIMPLTNLQAIYVVQMYGLIYILSVSNENVNLIEKIDEPQRIRDILGSKHQESKFNNIFKKIGKK